VIGEAIKRPGEKGSGGGAEAFKPGVRYVCSKAARIEMRNIASSDWHDAAEEMLLTSELNSRVQKPYYHLVLSWHEQEQPSDDQMIAAAEHMIQSLGLDEHQIVIGTHHDTARKHIHLVCNTVHPTTGKVWSKSNDHLRIEQACREIEIKQGWSHDRGRFDFHVSANGAVELKRNPDAWERKLADREIGKRPKSAGSRKAEKSTGFETFEHGIPPALKARFAEAVGEAYDWQSLHDALGELGLRYYKAGSGARVGILGSAEYAKASAFGSKFSISKMEKAFGPYEEPAQPYRNDLKEDHLEIGSLAGSVADEDKKSVSASSFKLTLLRRIYCDLHLDAQVSKSIRYVELQDPPPQITFRDHATVVDHGSKISTSKSTAETRAAMIAMAKAKGWSSVTPSGSPEFVRLASLEAAKSGLAVHGVPADLQAQCDAIIERQEKAQRRIDMEAMAAEKEALEGISERDQALAENDREHGEKAADEVEATAEARAVIAALGSGRDPVRTALRTVAREEEQRIKSDLPDRRKVSEPQPAPDADKSDGGKTRRIKYQLRENSAHELEDMRTVHIDTIAAAGGWEYAPKHPDGHNDKQGDKQGRDRRTYTRGIDTIKCTRKGNAWVWVSNKSGESGSVIDLWLADNPGKTLGDARKAFRDILGTTPLPAVTATSPAPEESKDHTHARRRWEEAPYIESQRTYAEDRGISKATLRRFGDQVRVGAFDGVYFAHRNIETGDIQGFEQRWAVGGKANHARFAKGGLKTICVLGNPKTASRAVIFEGGLDALALAEIEGRDDTIYVSTGGGFGPKTEAALLAISKGKEVLSGFDNDAAGDGMHKRLKGFLPNAVRHAPPSQIDGSEKDCKDWLDILHARKSTSAMTKTNDDIITPNEEPPKQLNTSDMDYR
jgi:relaxase-like protein/conjugative element/phage-associated large polyvalent protein/Toprim domain-containing protein/DNA relaxase TraI-like protein